MSDTSYAVLTRAKAKFGKRLRERDYKSMMECDNVAEVMAYLKSNTRYIEAFGEANERGIRRGLFENLLKQYMTDELDIMCRYELSVGEDISKYIAHKTEIQEIIRILTLLNSGDKSSFNFSIPPHIAKNSSINLTLLAQAKDYGQFLEAIKKTRYAKLLRKYQPDEKGLLPITEIENKLFIELYMELYAAVSKADDSEKTDLINLLDMVMDFKNFIAILRLKKYYKVKPDILKKYLIPLGSLSESVINEMLTAESSAKVYEIMERTRSGRLIPKLNSPYSGEIPIRAEFYLARKNMYYSDSPATVMISYILLSEIELHNMVCVIEGVRYHIDKEKIENLLIY